MKSNGQYSESIVMAVNEVYHDMEGDYYLSKHPEIFGSENKRWERLLSRFFPQKSPLRVLDFGSGTGFIGKCLLKRLAAGDTLISADISAEMLGICERGLRECNPACELSFVKLTGTQLPLPDSSVDLIVMNSVLHHLPSPESFAKEVARVLVPGGRLIIAHEPNRRYFNNMFLWKTYHLISGCLGGINRLRRGSSRSGGHEQQHEIIAKVNTELIKRGIVTEPFSDEQVRQIVDFASPTATAVMNPDLGFDLSTLSDDTFTGFTCLHTETYNHLNRISRRLMVFRMLDGMMATCLPKSGSMFAMVLEKH